MPLEPNRCFEKLCLPPLSLNPKTHTPPASTQLHMLFAKEVPNSEPQKLVTMEEEEAIYGEDIQREENSDDDEGGLRFLICNVPFGSP